MTKYTIGATLLIVVALAVGAVIRRGHPHKLDAPAPSVEATSSAAATSLHHAPPSRPSLLPSVPGALVPVSLDSPDSDVRVDVNLAAILERHQGMAERFEKEPHNPAWATDREKAVHDSVERDFAAGKQDAWVSAVRCRTTMCLLEVASPSEAALERAKIMLSYTPSAPAIQYSDDSAHAGNEHVARFVLEFAGKSHDSGTFAAWQLAARQTALDDLSRLRVGHSVSEDLPPPPPL